MNDTMYQVMPPLTADEYDELKSDIQQRGVMVPVEYDEEGNILDGHHRIQICEELGITDFPKIVRTGMTESEKRTHARKLNMARRQLSREQRRDLILDEALEHPEKSDRQIAKELSVSPTTVGTVRAQAALDGQVSKLDTSTGADGKQYPRQVERKITPVDDEPEPTYPHYSTSEYEDRRLHYQLDELMQEMGADDEWEEQKHEPVEHKPHVTANSGNNEWYTPSQYIEIAREVLGEIDLDPASCEFANRTVKATTFYSAQDDGLTKPWHGKVWMNPPYSADLVSRFSEKLVDEYNDGNVTDAIVLVNNATETAWFCTLVSAASAVVFPRGRIRYTSQTRDSLTPLQGQAFIYFGEYPTLFMQAFSNVGWGAIVNK